MGVTALSAWAIGARLLFSNRIARWVLAAALVQLVAFSLVVLVHSQEFWIALVDNLPAVLFLLIAFGLRFLRQRQPAALLAAEGLALALAAGLLQQLGVGIHKVYFNHNALYHVLQAIALFLFFRGARDVDAP
jgi:hypothetical protein